MKKLFLGFISVVVVGLLVLTGCGESEPEAPTLDPDKVYHLKYTDWGPEFWDIGVRAAEWIEEVKNRTGGKVIIEGYWSASLVSREDTYQAVDSGLTDIALYVLGGNPGIHVLNRVIDLPGTGILNERAQMEIYQKLRDKFPELEEEYGNVMILRMMGLPPEHIHTTDKFKQVITPEDLAGLKTYANQLWADQISPYGVAVINPSPMEWYTSLETNLMQGMFIHWNAVYDAGLLELFKYHTVVGEGGTGMQTIGWIMNRDSFNQLPQEYRDIIMETAEEWNEYSLEDSVNTAVEGRAAAIAAGHIVVDLTPAQQQVWLDLATPIHEQWIAEAEAAGFSNARDIFDYMMELIEDYK